MNDMKEPFAECIPFDGNLKGRIGGNPPKSIEGQVPESYQFYATLVHPEQENTMLSILIHGDSHMLVENNIYPSVEVKVIAHEYAEPGTDTTKCILDLSVSSISDYSDKQESKFLFIKVNGPPRLIQPKKFYYKNLENNDYSFLYYGTWELLVG